MVRLRQDGKQKSKVFPTLELAREKETVWKGEILRGDELITRKKPVITLDNFWKDHYFPWAKENKKSWKTDQSIYSKHIKKALGEKTMNKVSPIDVERLLSAMKKQKSMRKRQYAPATLRGTVVLLSHMLSLARKWGLYKGNNPCELVTKPKVNNLRTEYLSHEQHKNMLETLAIWKDKMAVAIISFAMLTGIRRGEIFKLRWLDINFEQETMLLRDPKGKKDVILPLSAEAIAVIKSAPKKYKSEYIFYGKKGAQRTDFKHGWAAFREKAGLPDDFRFHGLRHHYASTLVSNGVDIFTVQMLLTHKSHAMTQRYSHLSPTTMKQATEKAGRLLAGKDVEPDGNGVPLVSTSSNAK